MDRDLLIGTVCDSEFQTDGAENRKAGLEKSVLVDGWTSSGMADECKVPPLHTRHIICTPVTIRSHIKCTPAGPSSEASKNDAPPAVP